jgi:hypothetical protein
MRVVSSAVKCMYLALGSAVASLATTEANVAGL